jgi:2-polyprenyl-6-methoxyphenol hydroxylase-like FAD-dependent oxidoreductase
MARVERLLIVGAGIAGLTLAAALHQHGFKPELVERSHEWQAVGAGIAVQPNGVRILQALGMGETLERAGTVIRSWDFCDQYAERLCETDLQKLWEGVGPFIGIERSKLQQVLREGATITPRLDTTITSLRENEHSVQVVFNNGESADYDLVVGADGMASIVRQLAFPTVFPLYAGQMVWRSLVPIRPCGLTRLQFLLGDGCFFGLCPVGNEQTYGFGNVTGPRISDPVQGRLSRLRERFALFGEPVQQYLAALTSDEQLHVSPIEWVQSDQWHTRRVVLIGDAAHASIPMMGQGGSLAMEDACILAEVLNNAVSIEHALDDYVLRRRERVSWVQQQSQRVAEGLGLPSTIRNATLRERGDQMMHARFSPLISAP